jgi:outer membrane autotransporter protein
VTVDGDGSSWRVTNLWVGLNGTGTLRIQGGGAVDSGTGFIGYTTAGSTSRVTVDGAGSTWTISDFLTVSQFGNGALSIQNGGAVSSPFSSIAAVAGSTGSVTVDGAGSTWTNSDFVYVGSSGNGTLTVRNGGTVSFGGAVLIARQASSTGTLNIGAASGEAAVAPGTLIASSVAFGAGAGKFVFNHTAADYVFTPSISGPGSVRVESGTTILSGANTYAGATSVTGGTLRVNGSLVSATTVDPGGTLGGSGTLGNTTINGGTLSPGNSIGTVTVAGNLAQAAASTYLVEVNAAGQSDRTNVTGTATLGGSVQVIAAPGSYAPSRTYTILNATGGRSGTFSGANVNSIFLAPLLTYDANNVFLTLAQTSTFLSIASTPNQSAAATATEALGFGNAVFNSVIALATTDQARAAYDALSGEVHASAAGVLIEDSRYVRNAVLGRLRQAPFDSGDGESGDTATAAFGNGGPALAYAAELPAKAAPFAPTRASTLTFWAQGFGAWGRLGGDGNAATVDRRLGGAIVGVDKRAGNGWQFGFAAGFSDAKVNVSARQSSATIESGHTAIYGGKSFGAFNLRAGAAYAHHRIDTTRAIMFPGFANRAAANYDGGTAQVFGEIGYGIAYGDVVIEPFAGLAWVQAKTNSFTETGGPAALAGLSNTEQTGTSTLGARLATTFTLANVSLAPHLSAAWQHAFSDVTPAGALAFASGGPSVTVAGVPLAKDSALLEASLDLRLSANATLGGSYLGQFARVADDHAVKGKFVWNF